MPSVTGGNNITSTNQIADGVIQNADVNAAAGIDASKIANDVETSGDQSIGGVKTFTSDPVIPDEAYGPSWNGSLEPATKNAMYDKIEALSLPFSVQDLPFLAGTGAVRKSFISSNTDGSVLVQAYDLSSTTITINRWKKDAITGNYYITHTTTLTQDSSELRGICVAGSYVYVWTKISTAVAVRRYDLADLANVTSMTGPGDHELVWSDGTDIFLFYGTSNWRRWTISGTTMTDQGSIAFTSSGNVSSGCISDGNYAYITDSDGTGQYNIRKYAITGGAVISTTSPLLRINADPSGGTPQLFIAGNGKLGIAWQKNIESNSARTGTAEHLMAITLP
jgi:hypothetical protein